MNGAIDARVLAGLEETMGGREGLREIIDLYLEEAGPRIQQLLVAARSADPGALNRIAHTLKSTSATLGATPLSNACRDLEALARAGPVPDAVARAETIRFLFTEVQVALRAKIS
jgi:HPt (histidine-containing phosphotransfer) domain-containing protein